MDVSKSYTRTPTPSEQIKVEPCIAMVKDLLVDNIDGHVIYFYDEAARIAKPDMKDKHRPVVGMPVVSVKIGDHCYHGLCDWVLVLVQYPMTYIKKLCTILHPLSWKILMLQLSLPIEILFHHLGLLEMLKSCVGRLNTLLISLFPTR